MPFLRRMIFDEMDQRRFSLVVLVTAAAYFFSIFDLSFILDGKFWYSGYGDTGQHVTGFYAFVRDGWHFPLFYTGNLGYPEGANIIFTDSIPIVALVCKILAPLLPHSFHPYGLWILLCYVLLAHALGAMLYHFGQRTLLAAVAVSLMAVMTPFFLIRLTFSHAALCGQFLAVYALLLYFKVADGPNPVRQLTWYVPLMVVALLVHPYFLAMTGVVYSCAFENAALQPGRSWRFLSINALAAVAAVAFTAFVSGHFSQPTQPTPSLGYGVYSMNLLSPVSPYNDNLLFRRQPDATGGQMDGFNYWGTGILFLLCGSAPVWLREMRLLLEKRLAPLLVGLVLLTIYALSNRIYAGGQLLLTYPLPPSFSYLANLFRGSGRFFWVVSYAIMALAIVKGMSLKRRWLAAVLVISAMVLQAADTTSIREELSQLIGEAEKKPVNESEWRRIIKAHNLLMLLPPTQCHGPRENYESLGRLAAQEGVPLQSVWAARKGIGGTEFCRTWHKQISGQGFRPGVLYVYAPKADFALGLRPDAAAFCGNLGGSTLCTLQIKKFQLPPWTPELEVATWPESQRVMKAPEMARFFGMGWSYVEEHGVWSAGYVSELYIGLPTCSFTSKVRFRIVPFIGTEQQVVTVSINGGTEVAGRYSEGAIQELMVPIETCNPANPLAAVNFVVNQQMSPLEMGQSHDDRQLGFMLIDAELL